MSHQGDESDSDDNFNTVQADISDDEGGGEVTNGRGRDRAASKHRDDQDDGDAQERPSKSAPKRSRDADGEDDDGENEAARGDDDEEDEEDEEEEDEDEDVKMGHRRKRRKDRRLALFDMEAEVDDEDEGEDEEKDGEEIEDFIDNDAHPDDIADSNRRLDDDRRHRELDRRRELDASLDAEKQAEILKEKYGKRAPVRGFGDSAVVPKRLLLPSVQDPGIWAVRCKEGKEREIIFSIMRRVEEKRGTAQELKITSAFERAGPDSVMKGYIYMEANTQNDIMQALDGIFNVYPRTKMELVPIKDMPDLLRVQKTPVLEPGTYVRIRKPAKYANDLAQVLNVSDNLLEAQIRFIPRIDYSAQQAAGVNKDGKRKRFGPVPRPPPRLFSDVEARKLDPRNLSGNSSTGIFTYRGETYENGFLIKDFKIGQLITTNVNPTLDEVTKFASGAEDGTENLDLKALAASLKDSNANLTFLPGDVIEVYEGEQRGVVGKATNVRSDIVTIKVSEGSLTGQLIEVPSKCLRKRFRAGDHVKVIGGSRYRDEVGMVVKVVDDTVTILTDQTNTEVTIFSKDLREADDLGGQGSLDQYSLLDLVQLDPTTVACIVKVDRESLVVLDQGGELRQVTPSQIANKLPQRKLAVAADRTGSEIRLDDVVREYGGQQRQGKIMHIHRAFVFLHSNDIKENAGVFVTKAGNVTTVAAKGGRVTTSGPDLNVMNPALKRNPTNNVMMPPKIIGRDKAIGHTVSVKKGGYKGLLGIVKDTTDTHCRVELHTKSKIVTVPKSDVIFKDKVTGQTIDVYGRGGMGRGGMGSSSYGSRDMDGGRTPAAGDRTPSWAMPKSGDAKTPAWGRGNDVSGSRTPAWADGSRTSNPYDGSRTSYGGATTYGGGSRTPAWSSSAKTPAHEGFGHGSKTPAYGSLDTWGAGSKTPAYGASAPTPGASGANDTWGFTPGPSGSHAYEDAPTPGGALSAPTPGAMLSTETPGVYTAPTPAVSAPTPAPWQGGWGADSAPTPAVTAPTPAAYYGAPTPGAYGGAPETPAASGPRYTDDD